MKMSINVIAATAAFVAGLCSSNAFAGASLGPISSFVTTSSGLVAFMAGGHDQKPSCVTTGKMWAFNATTPGGKIMLATLMSAMAQGRQVFVNGTGVCSDEPGSEMPSFIVIRDQ